MDSYNSYNYDQDYLFDCDSSDLPSFEILFGGYWLQVRPEDYIRSINGVECYLCLRKTYWDNWIIGSAVLKDYYSIFDRENMQVGFVPFTGSGKPAIVQASSTPTTELGTVDVNVSVVDVSNFQFLLSFTLLLSIIGWAVWRIFFKGK